MQQNHSDYDEDWWKTEEGRRLRFLGTPEERQERVDHIYLIRQLKTVAASGVFMLTGMTLLSWGNGVSLDEVVDGIPLYGLTLLASVCNNLGYMGVGAGAIIAGYGLVKNRMYRQQEYANLEREQRISARLSSPDVRQHSPF